MNILKYQTGQKARETLRVINRLTRSFNKEYHWLVNFLAEHITDPQQVEELSKIALKLSQLVARLEELKADKGLLNEGQSVVILQQMRADILHALQAQADRNYLGRQVLITTLGHLNTAEKSLPGDEDTSPLQQRRVVINSELLYQAYLGLFPAEKMLIGAGRGEPRLTMVNALFDVTGAANAGHVRANPNTLSKALIAMDCTDTYLAAWLHSHPGHGPQATHPSAIDLTQHQDWINNYSPALVSIIFVEDGWLRFWGSGLESGLVLLEIEGNGITKEDEYDWVYHIYG